MTTSETIGSIHRQGLPGRQRTESARDPGLITAALLLSLACSSAWSAERKELTSANNPPADSRGAGKTVVATVVSIDFVEDLLESREFAGWWTVKAEVLKPRRLAGTFVVINIDREEPTAMGRQLAVSDRLAFMPPKGWQGRELWSGQLDVFEVLEEGAKALEPLENKS